MKTKHPELNNAMKKAGKESTLKDYIAKYDELAADYAANNISLTEVVENYKFIMGYISALYDFKKITWSQCHDCLAENDRLFAEVRHIRKK